MILNELHEELEKRKNLMEHQLILLKKEYIKNEEKLNLELKVLKAELAPFAKEVYLRLNYLQIDGGEKREFNSIDSYEDDSPIFQFGSNCTVLSFDREIQRS